MTHVGAYDVIVVGTGMGGSAASYILAQENLNILIIEAGPALSESIKSSNGKYLEDMLENNFELHIKDFKNTGRACYTVNSCTPIMGSGEGGGTALYGSVLLRPHPIDLQDWPQNTYEDLLPYFLQAEKVLGPAGEDDPLRPDLKGVYTTGTPSQDEQTVKNFFSKLGMHPFLLPLGMSNREDCEKCIGRICPKNCKRTAANFLEIAKSYPNFKVEFNTALKAIHMNGTSVSHIVCHGPEGEKIYHTKYLFLATGALITPIILRASKNTNHPKGLGNRHDLVGRFLMRHLIDFHCVKLNFGKHFEDVENFAISFSDYYRSSNYNFGMMNITKILMPTHIMANFFLYNIKQKYRLPIPYKLLSRLVRLILNKLFKNRIFICPIVEDAPSYQNRVLPDSTQSQIKISYKISPEDNFKLKSCRRLFKKIFANHEYKLLKASSDPLFLAHSCGTCRLADHPEKGVVDPNGKVFGVENLYICDASLFPTSCGVNPSLTIAALSMKIADQFVKNVWRRQKNG